ncbi:hypothetical protein ABT071_13810 [Streptomyces sp. NPDC002506]|uniref:hypothetical protein n=1 Tax=Streptomyces sp. NPDC002506 TaxID=3154536 RepID=UPI00332F48BC
MSDLTPEQQTIAAWLTANGIDPRDVPLDSELTTDTGPDGTRTIRYTTYVRDTQTGYIVASRYGTPEIQRREVPLLTAETLSEWIAAHAPAAP